MLRSILALLGLAVVALPASADYVTPDSILRPPASHPGIDGTVVNWADWATTQYSGLGLDFHTTYVTPEIAYGTGIASVRGVNVWSPTVSSYDAPGHSVPKLGFLAGAVDVGLAHPAESLGVDVRWAGTAGWFDLVVRYENGAELSHTTYLTPAAGGTGSSRISLEGDEYGGGLVGFRIGGWPDMQAPDSSQFAWGIAGLEFTAGQTVTTPEPGALALAAFGVVGLLARYGWAARTAAPRRQDADAH